MKFASATMVFGIWLTTATAGALFLYRYENAPGAVRSVPREWPEASQLTLEPNRPTLLFFAHPQCPCTRASIEELNRLMAGCQGQVACKALFFQPSNRPLEWTRGSLWKSAAAIPGVIVQADADGAEARRFGAETSGFVVLFDAGGQILFRGGITSGRGHAGDNPGADAIASLVNGNTASIHQTPVFGCGLLPASVTALSHPVLLPSGEGASIVDHCQVSAK
jgi:hypothetical protein